MRSQTENITQLIEEAGIKARAEITDKREENLTTEVKWPIDCKVGPGLEGAIACESKIGYVNGTKGWLIYRGYDIFDLAAHATYEETAFLLIHGSLPTETELKGFKAKLFKYSHIPHTMRHLMGFPVENLNPMEALRLGINLLRQKRKYNDQEHKDDHIHLSSDEDSIPMETPPTGNEHAIYEFDNKQKHADACDECCQVIAGVGSLTAAIGRIRKGQFPIEPDPELSYAGNFLYMLTGKRPSPLEERIMDISLILHADHGMNASTFSSMVVASTLSDMFFAVGSGVAALNGPLHGGANEEVLHLLREIGSEDKVAEWYKKARADKRKVMGFGHRVYKAYDPRARVLGPLAEHLAPLNKESAGLYKTAKKLESEVISALGEQKGIFPNVDFYSGLVYMAMGIPVELYTPIFAVSRVAGWTARVIEYLEHNRIFRPRAIYTGKFDEVYNPIDHR
jgi:citrate synthase